MGKRSLGTLAFVLLYQILSINIASAGYFDWPGNKDNNQIIISSLNTGTMAFSENIWNFISQNQEEDVQPTFKVIRTHTVRATGYSSTPGQTDDTPFITASGTYVRDGIIAANFHINGKRVPFGTLVRIPEIYGEKVFVVEDRMNSRYTNNIDIWFAETSSARSFGSKKVTIEVVEES